MWQAREAHRQSSEHGRLATRYRKERDRLIRQLHASGAYSYSQLAKQIGCSSDLVAKAVQGRRL
jgi:transposase-like protein